MTPQSAARLMRIAAWLTIVSGIAIAAAVIDGMGSGFDLFLGLVIPGSEGMAALASTEAKMITAIDGGLLAGFGAMLLLIAAPAIEQGNSQIMRAATISLLVWFVIDGVGSAIAGAPLNILSNSLFLIAYLLPLIWVRDSGAEQKA